MLYFAIQADRVLLVARVHSVADVEFLRRVMRRHGQVQLLRHYPMHSGSVDLYGYSPTNPLDVRDLRERLGQ